MKPPPSSWSSFVVAATLACAAVMLGDSFPSGEGGRWRLEHAFDGHRLCEADTRRPAPHQPPKDVDAEWVRHVDTAGTSSNNFTAMAEQLTRLIDGVESNRKFGGQGSLQESLHPNEFGPWSHR